MFEQLDLDQIQDVAQAKRAIVGLLNLVEDLQATVRELQAEIQRLRDEINRLKGEQGKPDIKPNRRGKQPGQGTDHSSEAERRKPQAWQKGSKLAKVKINREEVLTVDPAQLPADGEFKGYEDCVVQDIVIQTDNVLYRKEKYYSPSERRTYLAELPPGYRGQFGPGIQALALVQYFACNMAEPKILEFFANVGIQLSAGELSNWLIKDWPDLHAEKAAIYEAGLRSSPWQHLDDTATRVNGQNAHCQLLLCDDAPQFNWVTEQLALCWIHEGRHYKKLDPSTAPFRSVLTDFTKQFWQYYDELLAYRQQPSAGEKERLGTKFDTLFGTVTGYRALDERIEKTKRKKASLLQVLDHPEIPLHNNPAELGARQRVRKRDVSFGPRTPDGAKAWDTFMTLTATAKKLGVSIYHYIYDRVSGAFKMPDLADTITQRAAERSLGASWDSA